MTQNSQRPVAMISACGSVGLVSKFTLFLSSESSLIIPCVIHVFPFANCGARKSR